METVRLVLVTLLLVITFFIYQAWQAQRPQPAPLPVAEQSTVPTPTGEPAATVTAPAAEPAPTMPQAAAVPTGRTIDVRTDVLTVQINTAGGDISRLELADYRANARDRSPPYTMLDTASPRLFYPQSGLLSGDGAPAPTHEATFDAAADSYRLDAGQDRLEVPLTWQDAGAGVSVRKVYTFRRGAYDVELRYEVSNDGAQPWQAQPYAQLLRRKGADAQGSIFMPASFQGAVYYSTVDKYNKVGYDDMRQAPLAATLDNGWIGLSEHYFLAAVLLDGERPAQCYTKALAEERYLAGCISGPLRIEPGQSGSWQTRLYAGPKAQDRLEDVAEGLALTVDYGKLTVIAQPVFWLLSTIHGVVGNWGVAIILVTLLIKLAFYRLSAASYRSMAHMRKVQPKIMALRERYKEDRQQLNEKMMELYRTEKINPLGGCLPILVQIPVFIALYWVLLESVELRHAPFMLWIQDLSGADPYYVLPVLMGVSMFVQQRMTPMIGMEPMQRRIMLAMPLVFTVFFALFPAGLVLYWFVNNVLSIAQQWFINHQLERKAAA
ncbi:MAG TPA: membrane protein insertase YidC [Gammaproteobacteria bacterium]|uniref:membrane protein insertase YidC n=1 Tax=Immundisolibacter sp. TaxID=1934948 RepID=UPI000E9C8DAB|nr:membrane protein insertase YidC [Gammaproteobacteria bacterium]HCZ48441.1 membrane protein insertase YidC [Gammaproteobacteria bacterium]MCH77879.1 membrane protein insertase YidC [Gammaproteobacteria bacterium]